MPIFIVGHTGICVVIRAHCSASYFKIISYLFDNSKIIVLLEIDFIFITSEISFIILFYLFKDFMIVLCKYSEGIISNFHHI